MAGTSSGVLPARERTNSHVTGVALRSSKQPFDRMKNGLFMAACYSWLRAHEAGTRSESDTTLCEETQRHSAAGQNLHRSWTYRLQHQYYQIIYVYCHSTTARQWRCSWLSQLVVVWYQSERTLASTYCSRSWRPPIQPISISM